jgi:hypothetical protein
MRRCCARRPVTHPVKLGFEAVQGGEDTQADAPRISKIKLRPLGSHRNTFGSPAPLAMLQTMVFEAVTENSPPSGTSRRSPDLKRGRWDRGWGFQGDERRLAANVASAVVSAV